MIPAFKSIRPRKGARRSLAAKVISRCSSTNGNDIEYLVTLNVSLDTSQRIELVNGLFNNNVTLNTTYYLTVRIRMDPDLINICKFAFSALFAA